MMNLYVYMIQRELFGVKVAENIAVAIAKGFVTDEILRQAVVDGYITKDQYSRATGKVLP